MFRAGAMPASLLRESDIAPARAAIYGFFGASEPLILLYGKKFLRRFFIHKK